MSQTINGSHYGEKVVALWTLGPAGDQNPKFMSYHEIPPDFTERISGYRVMETLGQLIGEEVIRVAGEIKRMASEVHIEADERMISLPARIPPRDAMNPSMEVQEVDALNIRLSLLMIGHIALTWVSGEIVTNIYI